MVRGRDEAGPVIATLRVNPEVVARDESIREKLVSSELILALAKSRDGDQRGVEEAMADYIRSHPDSPITKGDKGPFAAGLYDRTKATMGWRRLRSGTGRAEWRCRSTRSVHARMSVANRFRCSRHGPRLFSESSRRVRERVSARSPSTISIRCRDGTRVASC